MANVCGKDLFVLSSNQVMPKKPFHDTGSDVIIPFCFFVFLSRLVYGNFCSNHRRPKLKMLGVFFFFFQFAANAQCILHNDDLHMLKSRFRVLEFVVM